MVASPDSCGIPDNFKWSPDFDIILERIASTDIVEDGDWPKLRDVIKFKVEKNTSSFLEKSDEARTPPRTTSPTPLESGGLRLPPFPRRPRDPSNPNEGPKSYMTEEEANELKNIIFVQLHDFEECPPFTIQRICELCIYPTKQYKTVGKYLRAVEKTLLVTSSWNAFPVEKVADSGPAMATITMRPAPNSTPTTPLFSPIPFLHGDARRSKSRSPPPSPLALSGTDPSGMVPAENLEDKAFGMVDEVDDPSPGHMSEHPTALSSVTTTSTMGSKPFLGSLEQRFAKSEGDDGGKEAAEREEDAMVVDDADDKENKG